MKDTAKQVWKQRAQSYNKLEWATSSAYERAFLDAGHFQKSDIVLDVGCGTGIISKLVAPHVEQMVGLDISPDMLRLARKNLLDNEFYILGDAYSLPFRDALFDKVTARMIFHHLVENVQKGTNECFRVLKPGGALILSEGIPPSEEIAAWYTDMFRLKEERLTFSRTILRAILEKAGFRHIEMIEYVTKQSSVKNWLENSGLPREKQDIIMQLHREMPQVGKDLYHANVTPDDVLIDMVFLIFVAVK